MHSIKLRIQFVIAILISAATWPCQATTTITNSRAEISLMASLWEADSVQISVLANAQYPQFTSNWQFIFPHSGISADGDIHNDMAVDSSGTGSTGNNAGESPIIAEIINATSGQLSSVQALSGHQAKYQGIFRFYTEHASERHFELHPATELDTWNGSAFVLNSNYRGNITDDSDGTTHPNSTLISAIDGSSSVTTLVSNDNVNVIMTFPSPSVNYVQYDGVVVSPVANDGVSQYFMFRPNLVTSVVVRCRLVAGTGAASVAPTLVANQALTLNALTRTDMLSVSNHVAALSAGQSATFGRPVELITLGITTSAAPPGITAQPQDLTVNAGQDATFSVAATGTGLSYQWQFNSNDISGATSSSFTRTNAQAVDAGNYSVTVSNGGGSVTSSNALLTVDAAPVITAQPQNVTAGVGQNVSFSVTAAGSPSPDYVWFFGTNSIAGATNSTLTRTNVQMTDAGIYSVVVSNNLGSATSSNATLIVVMLSGTSNIVAQWNFNNTNSSTSPAPSIGSGTAGAFGGTTTAFFSGSGNDTNASNSGWSTMTYPAQGTGNKTRGAQFKVSTLGYQNITLSWDQRLSATASKYYRLQYSVDGSNFTDYGVVTMITNGVFESKTNDLSSLSVVNNNSNFTFRILSEFESSAITNSNSNYATTVTGGGGYGTGGTSRYDLMTVYGTPLATNTPPMIMVQPQDQVAVAGSNVTFSVTATGTPPLIYQWRFNSNDIAGATNTTVTLDTVTTNQAGLYSVRVSGSGVFVTSSNAVLSVYPTAAASSTGSYSGGQFQLNVAGVPGFNYIVQASQDLTNWTPVLTNTSPFTFNETNNFPARFYRTQHLPQ